MQLLFNNVIVASQKKILNACAKAKGNWNLQSDQCLPDPHEKTFDYTPGIKGIERKTTGLIQSSHFAHSMSQFFSVETAVVFSVHTQDRAMAGKTNTELNAQFHSQRESITASFCKKLAKIYVTLVATGENFTKCCIDIIVKAKVRLLQLLDFCISKWERYCAFNSLNNEIADENS